LIVVVVTVVFIQQLNTVNTQQRKNEILTYGYNTQLSAI